MSDGRDGRLEIGGRGQNPPTQCRRCGRSLHQHLKRRVYPDDGEPGSWHWEYDCPEGSGVKIR